MFSRAECSIILPNNHPPFLPEELDTNATLLLRLRDQSDQTSWAEFVEIYTPLLFAYCQKRGLQSQDSADIIQNVFLSVTKAIQTFDYDPEKGRFKAWLFTILRHAISAHFRKQKRLPSTTSDNFSLEQLKITPSPEEEKDWNQDYQVQLLRWAMEKIKPEFSPRSWTIFYQTAIEERSPEVVASQLDMTKNAVNVQKFRVVQRLRQKLQSIDAAHWETELSQKKP